MTAILGLIATVVAIIFLTPRKAEGSVPESGGLGAAFPQLPKLPGAPAAPAPAAGVQPSNPGAYNPTPPPALPPQAPAPALASPAGGFAPVAISSGNFYGVLRPIADQILMEYGFRPELSLAQWAHETGKGTGEIFKATNNLGSITAGSWAYFGQDGVWHAYPGKDVLVRSTVEYSTRTQPGDKVLEEDSGYTLPDGTPLMKVLRQVPFRKYPTLLAAARDWAELIAKSSRYAPAAAALKAGDVEGFGAGLVSGGYATDPAYAVALTRRYSEIA